MPLLSHTKRLVDGQKVFLLWNELGSVKKVMSVFEKQGIVNPNTSKPYSEMTLWGAAMRWVIENPEESKPYFDKAHQTIIPQKQWEVWMIHRAIKIYSYSRRRIIAWAKMHDLYPKYKPLIDSKLRTYTEDFDNSFSGDDGDVANRGRSLVPPLESVEDDSSLDL